MGYEAKTKNGYEVRDLRPYDWGAWGKEWQSSFLNCSNFPSAIWDLNGKAFYVHNLENYDHIEEFDLLSE